MDQFTNERDAYAPLIYKILTFSLVENYSIPPIREFFLVNFTSSLKQNPNIPLGILLDPLLKQMQVTDSSEINLPDFDFFQTIAKHPKLNVKNAIQVLDWLGKVYLSSTGFGQAAGIPFVIISSRFIETSPLQEYLYRYCKYGLKLAMDVEKQRKAQAQKKVPKYLTNALAIAGLNEELPEEAITGQRRVMTYDMVARVIGMRNISLNIRLKELLIFYNLAIKKETGRFSKGMSVVLGLLGNAEEILAKAEDEEQKSALANSSDQCDTLSNSGKLKVESLVRSYIGFAPFKPAKASSRMPKRRVLKAIERAKKRREERQTEKAMKEDEKKRQEDRQKRLLRKQFQQMKVTTSRSECALILPEAAEIPQKEQIWTDLSLESAENQEGVKLILRKYARMLKLLFARYGNSGYRPSNQLIGELSSLISEAELLKMLKEQGVSAAWLSKEAHLTLFRTYCLKSNRADNTKVDYEGFLDLIVQEALYIFSKAPKDLGNYPPFVAVSALFDLFHANSVAAASGPDKDKAIPLKYYEEPDPGAGDREIVRKLNLLLAQDPSAQLPEGYRRVTDKELEVKWALPDTLLLPDAAKTVLNVLEEVVFAAIKVHILEPQFSFVAVVRARGVLAAPTAVQSSATGQSSARSAPNPLVPQPIRPTIDPEIKYQSTLLSAQYPKPLLAECATLLDDLLYSVEMKSLALLSKDKKSAAQMTNKVKLMREMQEKEMVLEREKAEQRRKLRLQVVKESLKKLNEEKQSASKSEQEQAKLSQQEKVARLQKRSEDRQKQREAKVQLIQEWRKRQNAEIDPETQARKQKEEEAKRKQKEEFLAKERKRIKDLLQAKERERAELVRKAEEEEKRKLDQRKNSKQRLILKLENDLKRREEEKTKRDQIGRLASEPEFASVLSHYERSIEVLFRHFSGQTTKADQDPVLALTALQYVGFNKFVTQMEISPNLVAAEYSLQVFRQLTKDKTTPESPVIALNLEEFKIALIRLAVGGKGTLRQMTGKPSDSSQDSLDIDDFKDFLAYLMLTPDVKKTAKMLQGLATMISKKRGEGSYRPSSKTEASAGSVKKTKSATRLGAVETAE